MAIEDRDALFLGHECSECGREYELEEERDQGEALEWFVRVAEIGEPPRFGISRAVLSVPRFFEYGWPAARVWRLVCSDCAVYCEQCGQTYHPESVIFFDDCWGAWCDNCAPHPVTCELCVEASAPNYEEACDYGWRHLEHRGWFCGPCGDAVLTWCDECDDYHHHDDEPCPASRGSISGLDFYCGHGWSSGGEIPSPDDPKLGFELEVEPGDDAEELGDHPIARGPWSFAEDCSIASGGFEVRSMPAPWSWWRGPEGRAQVEHLMSIAGRGWKSFPSGRCGLHVHVDQRSFAGDLALAKALSAWCVLWPGYFSVQVPSRAGSVSWLGALTRRELGSRARRHDSPFYFCAPSLSGAHSTNGFGRMLKEKWSHGKYRAAHLHSLGTVELRAWRGTLSGPSFWASLELSAALPAWASSSAVPLRGAHLFSLCAWVLERRELYPLAADYLRRRRLDGLALALADMRADSLVGVYRGGQVPLELPDVGLVAAHMADAAGGGA